MCRRHLITRLRRMINGRRKNKINPKVQAENGPICVDVAVAKKMFGKVVRLMTRNVTSVRIKATLEQSLEVDPALKKLMAHTASDAEYQTVIDTLCKGTAMKDLHRDHPAHKYRSQWDAMAVDNRFLMYHNQIVVPKTARKAVLSKLHVQHTGQTKI